MPKPRPSSAPRAPSNGDPSSISGPAVVPLPTASSDELGTKALETDELASRMPFNANKAVEYGDEAARRPEPGETAEPDDPIAGASTVQESRGSEKLGSGGPVLGGNKTIGPLDRVRADATSRRLTTNQGVPVGDNQHSLKAGLRGPTLLEDFILREKLTHFDHERIPERIVHARGSAAHGVFQCYEALTDLTRASIFADAGKETPVFVRFSTVLGERGSADTARDVRGFAVKFYTDEGNWDLVGNNMPVFFIQDAMKFPDLVHAAKPEPHHGMPQAGSAHDTFWDFASLMPEITHMLMWAMSDRAIPRSYRMMQGFGVHTFRLVNAEGVSHFVKFHWEPLAGTHSLVWDEAVKIAGADPDFHRRDLWESIEAGVFPEFELGLQVFTEAQAEAFSFDVLDATKLIPEELVPVRRVGRMTLTRNPDNFFAETEQVAFCTAHVVPGIDFSNDPLLAGRIHSYVDTQISRLGGPNFHEIPINAPIAPVHNNQRDGLHRQALHRGRVAYEPNSLGGGCPFQAGAAGFVSFPAPREATDATLRGAPEKFAEHYAQARLFLHSQTPVEVQHIVDAFTFELSRVQTPAVRERMVAGLLNVDAVLAERVAAGLGITPLPPALPLALEDAPAPEVAVSPTLSLNARPGPGDIRGRRVAVLAADGSNGAAIDAAVQFLKEAGAVPRVLAAALGAVATTTGPQPVDSTWGATPSVLYDAVVVPGGDSAALAADGRVLEFLKDQYRHCKPLLVAGAASAVLRAAAIPTALPGGGDDPGLIVVRDLDNTGLQAFHRALAAHRHFGRETQPPRI
jgi:catalase